MKYLSVIATVFLLVSASAKADDILPDPGAGPNLNTMGVASGAFAVFMAYKLGQLYQAGEVQHRKLTRCEWTGEGCGTPEGSKVARFYSVDGKN